MTIADKAASTPILPSLTGNAGIDSLLRGGIIAVSSSIAAFITAWLYAHGFHDPNLNTLIFTVVSSTLAFGATMVWGYVSRVNAEKVAQVTRTIGVRAGAAQALDPAVETPAPHTISPPEAQAIVAAYEPVVVTPDLKNPKIGNP
jgi:hypothetical protein